jgi:hypothetical protein
VAVNVIEGVLVFAAIILCGSAVGYAAAYFILWLGSH